MSDATFLGKVEAGPMAPLPGDPTPKELVLRVIRVDHAGEYGAVRIYAGQLAVLGQTEAALGEDERELRETIERFRAEELEHRDIGLEHEAELAPAFRLLSAVSRAGCRLAIRISERN